MPYSKKSPVRQFFLCFLLFATQALSASLAIHCGALLDPATDTVTRDVVILTEGGIVKQISPAASAASLLPETSSIDVSQGFCLPGLIDVHDHLTAEPKDAGYASLGVS